MTTVTTVDGEPLDRLVPHDTFGARLVLIRHEIGQAEQGKMLSIEEIARRCDVKPATWSTWERGTSPQQMWDVVRKIVDGTGYDRTWIAFGGVHLPAELELLDGGGQIEDQPTLPFRSLTPVP